ncbi:MAG: metallophosphoesterase [Thermoguttaceae bacterium]|nr:metallophosphoesterase [Thermoguttaceae bacterium]MDW8038642.1 metallophosphoesterase [Thermoguttaceae bacterium]
MRLLGITDLHGAVGVLQRILQEAGPVDLVLLGGDITNFGTPDEVELIVKKMQQDGLSVLAVAGNCDSPQIEQRLQHLGVSLYRRAVVLKQVGFQGLSGMPPWKSRMYHFSEEQLAEDLQEGYRQLQLLKSPLPTNPSESLQEQPGWKTHILLSHVPPRDCKLDRTFLGRHVGSQSLRRFIDQVQPDLVVCGHIHEGRGLDRIGRTWILNCGAASAGNYGLIEVGSELRLQLRRL